MDLVRSGGHDLGLFGESDLGLALVAVAASLGWLAAAGAVLVSRAPPQPRSVRRRSISAPSRRPS